MTLIFIEIILFIFCYIYNVKSSTVLNALAFTQNEGTQIYTYIINDFNEYSIQNNLDVTINLNLFTPSNSTKNTYDFCSVIDQFLKKKSGTYDIYFYNNIYTTRFEPHFMDLNKLLPKNHTDMYEDAQTSESYSYNNKLIGLPVFINYSVMYNNVELLNKYNKTIPKTWDELLQTGKYILEHERNNTDFLVYNGAFIDDEIGMGSVYEFMYSFRDKVEDPFPDLLSENAVNSLIMMKKLKNEISSESIFKTLDYSISKLTDGNGLFIKFNYLSMPIHPAYKATIIPGNHEGVSGSVIGGYNIGLSSFLKRENLESSVKAVQYITSREVQKKMMTKYKKFSGISSLFDDEDNCDLDDFCDVHKKMQPIARPTSLTDDYNSYSEKFRYYIYKYLYGEDDVDPLDMLKEINEITRFHYVSIKTKDSPVGKIIGSVYLFMAFFIIVSSYFLFDNYLQLFFSFLTKDYWILILFGYILVIVFSYLDLEKVTVVNCHLKQLFEYLSFTFIFIPILHKLISNYPEENSYSDWINHHRYLFILIFIIMDLGVCGLTLFSPYTSEDIIVNDGKNFHKCKSSGGILSLLSTLLIMIKLIVLVESLILIYMERQIEETYYDLHFCASAYLIDIVLIIAILVINSFEIHYYELFVFTRQTIFMTFLLSNYFFLYFIRSILTLINKDFYSKNEIENIQKSMNMYSTNGSFSYSVFSRKFTQASDIIDSVKKENLCL